MMTTISASQTFNNTIAHIFTNLGSYSLIKDINSDSYYQLNYQINNISLRIKNGQINTRYIDELYDQLQEIKIACSNIDYIIDENYTLENVMFGLELLKLLIQLLDLLISYHMENNINRNDYELRLSNMQHNLFKQEQYFNHNILKGDQKHEHHIQKVIENIDKNSLVSKNESDFLSELEKW